MIKKIIARVLFLSLVLNVFFVAPAICRERKMKELYDEVLSVILRATQEKDILVVVGFETTAYRIAEIYKDAETQLEQKEWINKKLEEFIKKFTGSAYPDDIKGKDNLYMTYVKSLQEKGEKVKMFVGFPLLNPKQKRAYYEYESKYIREVMDSFNKHSQLTNNYHPDSGYQCYDRLVFRIYLENLGAYSPYIADIGNRTFLEDDKGNIYKPEGRVGPYPYEFDKPKLDRLIHDDSYRLYFPARHEGKPIIHKDTKYIKIVIYDLGEVDQRQLIWELLFEYPKENLIIFGKD